MERTTGAGLRIEGGRNYAIRHILEIQSQNKENKPSEEE